jgi:hypothetical protein
MSEADGVKRLTAENWLEPDPTGAAFGEINLATGEKRSASADRWAQYFLEVELSTDVPRVVRDMWAIARGVLMYGWFFYPLYALGDHELHRVADAAVRCRYEQASGPPDPRTGLPPSFKARLRWLADRGIVRSEVVSRWDAIRELRNEGSHAEFAHIAMPLDALRSLEILATEINALFETP